MLTLLLLEGCVSLSLPLSQMQVLPTPLRQASPQHASEAAPQASRSDNAPPATDGVQAKRSPSEIRREEVWREALNKDQWRTVEIWPGPLAGPRAVRKLVSVPRAHWHLQGLPDDWAPSSLAESPHPTETTRLEATAAPESVDNNSLSTPETDALNSLATESTSSTSSLLTEQRVQDRRLLRRLAEEDSLIGWNALLLLATTENTPLPSAWRSRLGELALTPPRYREQDGRPLRETSPAAGDSPQEKPHTEQQGGLWNLLTQSWSAAETSDEKPAHSNTSPAGLALSENFQAAAAEAWCHQLALLPGDPEAIFVEAGRALQYAPLPPSVKHALTRGIARRIPPRRIPGIEELFAQGPQAPASASKSLLAGLDACLIFALHQPEWTSQSQSVMHSPPQEPLLALDEQGLDPGELWPVAMWNQRWNDLPEVVVRFGLWLAITEHPLAEGYLRQNLQHREPAVQWACLRSLGLLESRSVHEELLRWKKERDGTPRAVALLAGWQGEDETVYGYRADASAVVRTTVARFAGEREDERSARILRELVLDDDPQVQQAALAATHNWPDQHAFPVLAQAFQSAAPITRKQARQQLEQRFGLVIASHEDSATERERVLKAIADRQPSGWKNEWNALSLSENESSSDSAADRKPSGNQDEDLADVRSRFQELMARLREESLPSAERGQIREELQQQLQQYPVLLERELGSLAGTDLRQRIDFLAELQLEPAKTLKQLEVEDVSRRRRAARRLAEFTETQPLPEWALRRMAEQMAVEQDVHVCRGMLQAIARDARPAARQMAEAALLHAWSDVRVLGCQYVEELRLPQLAPFLLPLFQERNPTMQLAAIRAAGACQNPLVLDGFPHQADSPEEVAAANHGLRGLLGTVSPALEWEVVASMARLGDEQGLTEVRKRCYAELPEARARAISLLGELGDERAVAALIRLGWTEQHSAPRSALLQSLEQLIPPASRPPLNNIHTYEAQLEAWAKWAEER